MEKKIFQNTAQLLKVYLKMINKKAEAGVLETTIFLVLNLVFIVLILFFVFNSRNGAIVYEDIYAKQIALIIDNAEPGMIIGINAEDLLEKAEKNKVSKERIVSIDGNQVIVRLSNSGGRGFSFFSDYNVETRFAENFLEIKIMDENEE